MRPEHEISLLGLIRPSPLSTCWQEQLCSSKGSLRGKMGLKEEPCVWNRHPQPCVRMWGQGGEMTHRQASGSPQGKVCGGQDEKGWVASVHGSCAASPIGCDEREGINRAERSLGGSHSVLWGCPQQSSSGKQEPQSSQFSKLEGSQGAEFFTRADAWVADQKCAESTKGLLNCAQTLDCFYFSKGLKQTPSQPQNPLISFKAITSRFPCVKFNALFPPPAQMQGGTPLGQEIWVPDPLNVGS